MKKKYLRAYVMIVVVQTLEETRNVLHVFVVANRFDKVACAGDMART